MSAPESARSTVVLPSGARVHRWAAGTPRAAVVLQHGFGEYAERYVEQHARLVPRLLAEGLDVWGMDLWGHGRSPGRPATTNIRLAVRDHLTVRELAGRAGLPVFAVGHSLGGLVTAASTLASSAGLTGTVLLSPAFPRPEHPVVRRLLGAVAAVAPSAPVPLRREPLTELSRVPEVAERVAADPMMAGRQMSVLLAATALDEMERLRRPAGWRVPTLVAHGTADKCTDPDESRAFVSALASPDATLHLVEGARHELLNDLCAQEVLALVLGWITNRLAPAGHAGEHPGSPPH